MSDELKHWPQGKEVLQAGRCEHPESASSLAAMPGSVESVNRQVIENQLLTALDDKSKVAILATEEDLTMLIICLGFSTGVKAKEMRADLQQLKAAAFPPNVCMSHGGHK